MWKGRERGKEKKTVNIRQWGTWTGEWKTKVMSRKGQCYWNFKSAAKCIRFTADASYAFSQHSLHLETQERYKTQTALKTKDWIKPIAKHSKQLHIVYSFEKSNYHSMSCSDKWTYSFVSFVVSTMFWTMHWTCFNQMYYAYWNNENLSQLFQYKLYSWKRWWNALTKMLS